MHIKGFLHKLLSSVTHKKRLTTLALLVETVIKSKKLSLSALARELPPTTQERHAIKRVDKFLGNTKLHKEREAIYKIGIDYLLGSSKRPIIIVDWSNIPNTTNYLLRAALVTQGRALSLYEEVYPQELLGNNATQKAFLLKLKTLLPSDVKPIILTDAGFYNDWFKAVAKLNWDYVGRLRGNHTYFDGKQWIKCLKTFAQATAKATHLGYVKLCKKNTADASLYLIKEPPLKHKKHINNKSGGNSDSYRKSANDPWLLASSLSGENISAETVINLYKKRMQIEEGFRDLKSSKYGLSFEHAYSKKIERIQVLLLLAMLASLIAHLTGLAAENENLHYQFQANTIRTRRVLSFFFLGCQIIIKKIPIPEQAFLNAHKELQAYAA
jgi:hypothetical protein